jgi:hypothetical protein
LVDCAPQRLAVVVLQRPEVLLEHFGKLRIGRRIDPNRTPVLLRELLFALPDSRFVLGAQLFDILRALREILREELLELIDERTHARPIPGDRLERAPDRLEIPEVVLRLRQRQIRLDHLEQSVDHPRSARLLVLFDRRGEVERRVPAQCGEQPLALGARLVLVERLFVAPDIGGAFHRPFKRGFDFSHALNIAGIARRRNDVRRYVWRESYSATNSLIASTTWSRTALV